MERKIAECSTYKELAQTMCDLLKFYTALDVPVNLPSQVQRICEDAQQRIDSYELDEPEGPSPLDE